MTDQLYRIKPLVWENPFNGVWQSYVIFGTLKATPNSWSLCSDEDYYDEDFSADNLHQAKAAAEAHYRERLMEALELVNE